jgi:hypothetical protein
MAKLTIEIDMEDPQETWDALYRRIEEFGDDKDDKKGSKPLSTPATYDLLLDPEHNFGEVGDFFAVFTSPE